MLKMTLKSIARLEFARREDGTVAIETVIILPLLFWTYLSMFSIFDAFRQYSINQKASFTIGDMISRETLPLDNDYLNGSQDLFDYLTRSRSDSAIRVSSLAYDKTNDKFKHDWSKVRGWVEPLNDDQVRTWTDRLPLMRHNERIMVVETWSKYDPPFNTGLEKREIRNFVFTRPRYAPRVLWFDDGRDGDYLP
ncbi:hypothetical protein C1J03_07830 [Sulfitobacter sp. SK012]|uniref:TadE/TadG family type IV pilus assembly protein n=1 Tax=Sulfitobacter sp. SK012 TaxID=1389005 RepID=UPI000E0BE39A|nr:TadE/TadG family type IV pilus assembly protein [Sulfitobacter sp. SK012]AXI45938.1 hypothetical protein C1J03_07830 [Sulfitobacter sp. SK012]